MKSKARITKILAIAGFVLVWFIVLSPLVLGIISLVRGGGFRFDYLMPAELSMVALVGGLLILWASLRSRSVVKWVHWAFAIAFVALLVAVVLAKVTGLADGKAGSEGWQPVAFGLIAIYDLGLVALGMGAWNLVRDLIKKEVSAQ
jgi:hypothetical protein